MKLCVLCGQNGDNVLADGLKWLAHRTTFRCKECDVNLCVKVHDGLRVSCWTIWHSRKHLEPRFTPAENLKYTGKRPARTKHSTRTNDQKTSGTNAGAAELLITANQQDFELQNDTEFTALVPDQKESMPIMGRTRAVNRVRGIEDVERCEAGDAVRYPPKKSRRKN